MISYVKQMSSLIVKVCIKCGATNTCRWYGGPTCNKCHGRNFKNKNPDYYKNYQYNQYHQDTIFREKDSLRKKKLYLLNKIDIIAKKRVYQRHKLKEDILFKLSRNLRSRLNKALRGDYKAGSAVSDLGCSIKEFKVYLESKFKPGMTWENYGKWHIDHIKPLTSFDLLKIDQVQLACNYTNLQPLWAKDNLEKSNKYE